LYVRDGCRYTCSLGPLLRSFSDDLLYGLHLPGYDVGVYAVYDR
jgi:hypothetical protein